MSAPRRLPFPIALALGLWRIALWLLVWAVSTALLPVVLPALALAWALEWRRDRRWEAMHCPSCGHFSQFKGELHLCAIVPVPQERVRFDPAAPAKVEPRRGYRAPSWAKPLAGPPRWLR